MQVDPWNKAKISPASVDNPGAFKYADREQLSLTFLDEVDGVIVTVAIWVPSVLSGRVSSFGIEDVPVADTIWPHATFGGTTVLPPTVREPLTVKLPATVPLK